MSKITKLEDIVSLCRRRGFIYQSSEIYGGQAEDAEIVQETGDRKQNTKET